MNGHKPSQESSESDSEPLAATSRRVHGLRARPARPAGHDSWDSDVPLHKHSKGKGIGKKSKSSTSEPRPSTSAAPPPRGGGDAGGSASEWDSACTNIEVLEEELLDEDVHLTYTDNSDVPLHAQESVPPRKRLRPSSSDGGAFSPDVRRKKRRSKHKRTREKFEDMSSSSSSGDEEAGDGAGGAEEGSGRYESDRSYHPRYSSDDDAPLHLYRQRAEGSDEAGPSNASTSRRKTNGHGRSGGVSLRARSPRLGRYNEDSEEDSAAAISKRTQHHRTRDAHRLHAARTRHAAGTQNIRAEGSAHADHNYFNGHQNGHPSINGHASAGNSSPPASPAAGGVSVSSRGRVRRLTAKARGLLRD